VAGVAGTSPTVSIVTVNYNGRALLATFLASAAAQDFPADELEVIVVDNGSSDGSAEYVRTHHPQVRLIEHTVNRGFAQANNDGARAARGRYLALLNNDMRLHPRWVTEMVSYLEREPDDVVCAGSLILSWDGERVDFGGSTMAFNGVGFQLFAGVPASDSLDWPDRILFACGGAMMISRDVYLAVGGFDDDYFAYLEDVDLGWRLWLFGHAVGFCPTALTYHVHNATSRMFDEHRKNVLIERNAIASVIKNYGDETLAAALPAALLLAVKRFALRSGVRRDEFTFVTERPSGHMESVADAITRKTVVQKARTFAGAFVELGPRIALRILKMKVRRALLGNPAAPRAAEATRPIPLTAYATIVALEGIIDDLPRLMERRRQIQAARRRSDAEIFEILGAPFEPQHYVATATGEYEAAFESVVRLLGVRERFEAGAPIT
jgi:GT2 family glycosyltransferase